MTEINKVHLLDCIEGLQSLENESADIIICDPPYNIGKNFEITVQNKI